MRKTALQKFTKNFGVIIVAFALMMCFMAPVCVNAHSAPDNVDGYAGTTVDLTHEPEFVRLANSELSVYEEEVAPDTIEVAEEPEVIDEVPLYIQNDYPDIPYSQGSVATSGCGITCMAMVATYMLDEVHMPDELALEYNGTASNNATRMENAATGLGLTWEKVYVWHDMIECLEEDKICIALMNSNSIFTDGGHFIVLTGITEDGKIMINDPWEPNNVRYADEFENGFEQWQVIKGFSGCWVFDKNAVDDALEVEINVE